MILETKRLNICELTQDMAEVIQRNSLDEETRKYLPDEVYETVEQAREAISFLVSQYEKKNPEALVYALITKVSEEEEKEGIVGENIGYVQAAKIDGGYEIGFKIAQQFRSNGYASEAVKVFLPFITDKLGQKQIYGITLSENVPSNKVLAKNGFMSIYSGEGNYQGEKGDIILSVWRKETSLSEDKQEKVENGEIKEKKGFRWPWKK